MLQVDQTHRASFQAEMDNHAESLWSVALWLTKRWSAAEALLAKTVSKAYGSWPESDKSISRKTWLFGVLAGVYFDDRPIRLKRGTLSSVRSRELTTEPFGQDATRTSPLDSRQLATLVRLSDESVTGAIARLSPETRLLLLLRLRENLSYSDIAHITGLRADEARLWLDDLRHNVARYILRQTARVANAPDNGNSDGPKRDCRAIPVDDMSAVLDAARRPDETGDTAADSVNNHFPPQSPGRDCR